MERPPPASSGLAASRMASLFIASLVRNCCPLSTTWTICWAPLNHNFMLAKKRQMASSANVKCQNEKYNGILLGVSCCWKLVLQKAERQVFKRIAQVCARVLLTQPPASGTFITKFFEDVCCCHAAMMAKAANCICAKNACLLRTKIKCSHIT